MDEAVILIASKRWMRGFSGTSSLDIAEKLRVPHDIVLRIIEKLVSENRGSANETTFHRWILFGGDGKAADQPEENEKGVEGYIYFPDKSVLRELFSRAGMDHGEFKNRLMRGIGQIRNFYFDAEVLEKYTRHLEKFTVKDDVINGYVALKDEYYDQQPEDVRKREQVGFLRYGRRRLSNGNFTVTAIAIDLARMSIPEQRYWHSHEIERPVFSNDDPEFIKYARQTFGGEFVDHDDPLKAVSKAVGAINVVLPRSLFSRGNEIHFIAPTVNTRQAYCDAHKELYKLIGADALDRECLREILVTKCAMEGGDLHVNGDKAKHLLGPWALLKKLVNYIPDIDWVPFERCAQARIEDAHSLRDSTADGTNWIEAFRSDCRAIAEGLVGIESFLSG